MMMTLLKGSLLPASGFLPRRLIADDQRVEKSDPAIHAMTDFTRDYPVTVEEDQSIDAALDNMIRLHVRAMLVVRGQKIVGFISSYDIQGERPIQYLLNSSQTRHRDIEVGHIMTPWADLVALNWRAIKDATVGEVLDVFHHINTMHLLVLETATDAPTFVRGLFSRTRIERQLAVPALTA
jgi:CBS domain-containing protein